MKDNQVLQDTDVLKFRGISGQNWINLVTLAFITLMSLSLLIVGGLESNGTPPFITGIFTTIFTLPIFSLVLSHAVRPIVLSKEALKIPRFISSYEIPTDEIAGVGLLFQDVDMSRAPSGWYIYIWDSAGKKKMLDKLVETTILVPKPANGKRRPLISINRDPTLPLPHEDLDYLTNSRTGKVAKAIYDFTLMVQGPTGPLATKALQKSTKNDRFSSTKFWAWWSPDGTMERIIK
ncbi:MAG: hypothetical protein HKL80_03110 [Acidimicrobiales bacterium]|nr:hypothetical protein [Acidimicrobiales bacterium]